MELGISFIAIAIGIGIYMFTKNAIIDKDTKERHSRKANEYRKKLEKRLREISEEMGDIKANDIYRHSIGTEFSKNCFEHSFISMYDLKNQVIYVLVYGSLRMEYGLKFEMDGLNVKRCIVEDGKYKSFHKFKYVKYAKSID